MKRRVLLLCFQNQRTVQQFKSGELEQTFTYLHSQLSIWRCSEGSVHTEFCQVKTCAILPDLELHNSNYMYLNAPLFIQSTWVHKSGGNVHTQYTCMQEARAHYANIKLQIESNRNEYPHCHSMHSNQISLSWFLVRKFECDFVVRYGTEILFLSEKYHTIKEWWGISLRIAKSGTVRSISNHASVGWDCELEPLSGQTFHQIIILNHCPGSSRVVVSYWRNMDTLWTGRW